MNCQCVEVIIRILLVSHYAFSLDVLLALNQKPWR
jgi:hypothetical protein